MQVRLFLLQLHLVQLFLLKIPGSTALFPSLKLEIAN